MYAYVNDNGSWGGVIGLLVSDEADVGIEKYGMTFERKAVVNYVSVAFNLK